MALSVIAIQVDEETNPWIFPDHWVQIKATEKMRRDYGVYSTPTLFLINSTSHQITSIPENMSQLKSMEHMMKKEN
jgi:thioredoxin-related protein